MSYTRSNYVIVSSPYKNLVGNARKKNIVNIKKFHNRVHEKNARSGTGTKN